ncbi:DUF6541 family protein [Brachybacterium alimentarium]
MSSVLPVLCGAVLLGAPGYLMLCALDVRLRLRWGWAPAVTVLLTVVLGALFRVLGIRWTLLSAVIGIVLLVALAAVVRLALQRRTAR